ncbi:MAG: SCO family protein [Planctomycetaceae bacterium]|nr:SCO family protein [Planctomycetaceae bacterium]
MKRGVLALWGLVFLALAGVYYWRTQHAPLATVRVVPESTTQEDVWPQDPVVDFELVDAAGQPFLSQQLRGKVWVASFFFANCPGFCLNLNQQIARLAQDLSDTDVQFVSFTVDPAHDTPAVLAEYAQRFAADPARWTFLTGEQATIERVAEKSFLVSAAPATHTGRVMLVDREGKVRGAYSYSSPAEMAELAKKVRELSGSTAKVE